MLLCLLALNVLAGGAAEGGSVLSSSSAGGGGTVGWTQSLDTEEKVAAALSAALASRATAEADAVEVKTLMLTFP